MDLPLPLEHEKILVCFQMPRKQIIWWTTVIKKIIPCQEQHTRAIANVEYEKGQESSGNSYKAELGTIKLLKGDRLLASSDDSSFPQGSETRWRPYADKASKVIEEEEKKI